MLQEVALGTKSLADYTAPGRVAAWSTEIRELAPRTCRASAS